MTALLTVDKLSKTYQATNKKAVKDISFTVDHSDIVAFLGLNGAGKTTTLKMILNLVSPDHGKVYFEGKEMTNSNLLLLKNTGVLLEGSRNMFWSLSPIENFIYWGGQRGLSRKEAEHNGLQLLKKFGLLDKKDTTITSLSRGMQQIVGICCAMIAQPKLLILDEPTLGLDLKSAQIVINILKELSADGVGVLITTHQLGFAQKVAQKILLINQGELVFSDNMKEGLVRLNKWTILKFTLSQSLTAKEKEKISTYCNLTKKQADRYQLEVKCQNDLPKVLQLLGELPISQVQTKKRNLEDIFEYYTGEE